MFFLIYRFLYSDHDPYYVLKGQPSPPLGDTVACITAFDSRDRISVLMNASEMIRLIYFGRTVNNFVFEYLDFNTVNWNVRAKVIF